MPPKKELSKPNRYDQAFGYATVLSKMSIRWHVAFPLRQARRKKPRACPKNVCGQILGKQAEGLAGIGFGSFETTFSVQ